MDPGKGKRCSQTVTRVIQGIRAKACCTNYVDQNEGPVRLNAMLALSYIGYAISEQVSRSQPFPLLIMPSLRTRERGECG